MTINVDIIKTLRKERERVDSAGMVVLFDSDSRRISYVIIKDHYFYGSGYTIFDGASYVATFSYAAANLIFPAPVTVKA